MYQLRHKVYFSSILINATRRPRCLLLKAQMPRNRSSFMPGSHSEIFLEPAAGRQMFYQSAIIYIGKDSCWQNPPGRPPAKYICGYLFLAKKTAPLCGSGCTITVYTRHFHHNLHARHAVFARMDAILKRD
jgi:hypothetical protein